MNVPADFGHKGGVPTLEAFRGTWAILRDIRDRLAGDDLRFEGSARFVPDANGLRYTETGKLLLPGGSTVTAQRRYAFREDAAGIEVFFQDGRPFHRIPRDADASAATHWCDPDSYTVNYDFASWPDWSATWQVRGPRKDYRMVTRYTRV